MNDKKIILLALVLGPFVYMWEGYVLMTLWKWFMIPIGFQPISIAIGAGLVLMSEFFKSKYTEDATENMMKKCLYAFVSPTVILIFGFLIQLFI